MNRGAGDERSQAPDAHALLRRAGGLSLRPRASPDAAPRAGPRRGGIRQLPITAITRTTPSLLTVFSIVTLIAAQRSA